ncbi:DUF2167 domain-containing protein [Myxococcaceae bacterium JPH2]|nr:DUF2167 domain-containing protein [Myxococcaceae bacterium JPH2]
MNVRPTVLLLLCLSLPNLTWAASPQSTGSSPPAAAAKQKSAAAKPQTCRDIMRALAEPGPVKVEFEALTLDVPPGLLFLRAEHAKELSKRQCGNPLLEGSMGLVLPTGTAQGELLLGHFGVGHLQENPLDERLLLASRKRLDPGTAMQTLDWHTPPTYDRAKHRATWALDTLTGGAPALHEEAYVLGRWGFVSVTHFGKPEVVTAMHPALLKVLDGIQFKPGARYEDYDAHADGASRKDLNTYAEDLLQRLGDDASPPTAQPRSQPGPQASSGQTTTAARPSAPSEQPTCMNTMRALAIAGPMKVEFEKFTFDVPAGFFFLGEERSKDLLKTRCALGWEPYWLGLIMPSDKQAALILTYKNVGYFRDERPLDAIQILATVKERYQRPELMITGWHTRPSYHRGKHQLTLAADTTQTGTPAVIDQGWVLGRNGFVALYNTGKPDEVKAVHAALLNLLNGIQFKKGARYKDYVAQDGEAVQGDLNTLLQKNL